MTTETTIGARGAGSSFGLDYTYQSSANSDDQIPAPDGCVAPHPYLRLLNVETGEVRPAGCRRLSCPACLRLLAWRRSLAIAWARPELAVTLTLIAPEDSADPWQDARKRHNRWREYYRQNGGKPFESVLHVERNPHGTGYHGHLWLHGSRLDFAASDAAARRAGLGWVHTEVIRVTSGASAYGLKGASYGLKGASDGSSGYLWHNGGRLTHQSRGFFRGLPVREAEKAALAERGDSPWVVTAF